ncbi:MAG: hypothetical protein ACOZCL_02545 [Bacillota bacterium]
MIVYNKFTPIIYTAVKENGIQLTMRYLCEPRKRRDSEHMIWEDILDSFHGCKDIDFAYPTYRIVQNNDIER